jgi:hypothetical protein
MVESYPQLAARDRTEARSDEKQRMLIQIVTYELFAADGTLVAASVERLRYWWFSDCELETSAQKAGLENEQTLTSFGSERGHERIYVLRAGDQQSQRSGC